MTTISVVDETLPGQRGAAWDLEVAEDVLPLRELVRRRVVHEVARRRACPADPQEEVDRALESFSRNGFFVLVDDRQVSGLDAEVDVRTGTEVVFLRLVPLVGG